MIIEKHILKFEYFLDMILKHKNDLDKIRFYISNLMLYLDECYLLDKNYLDNSTIFLKSEKDLSLIKEKSIEELLSFLTMINRIDYIDSNSDAYIMYHNNGMISEILVQLIYKLKKLLKKENK